MESCDVDASAMQAINWSGCIPVQLTLAPTSVSSPTIPPPIHLLVPRHSFLHAGLHTAVQRFFPFAPLSPFLSGRVMLQISEPNPRGDSDGDDDNDQTGNDSRDSILETTGNKSTVSNINSFVYPPCWFEDENIKMAVRWHLFAGVLFDMKTDRSLPWKLRLHFTNYPASQILPLDHPVLTNVQASYKHSLKQAMTVASSNSRTAMNVTKESHGLLWEAITSGNFPLYHRVDLVAARDPVAIPVRVLVNASNPPIQRRVEDVANITLGRLLLEWLPEHFVSSRAVEDGTDNCVVAPNETVLYWRVVGIEPPMTTLLLDLWKHCSHPDHFLYIIVLTTTR